VLSFKAQITNSNFIDIWDIALKLKIPDLKQAVVQYVIKNRDKLHHNERMSTSLMLEVMKAAE
jgi:hypothetical protein